MIKLALVAGGSVEGFCSDADYYIGVDAGSLFLLDKGLPLKWAVGDFDSVNAQALARIKKAAEQVIQASSEKEDTDLELALKEVFQAYPDASVTVYGALGGRMDHMLANLFLASEPNLADYMERIELVDSQNRVRFFPAGQHQIPRRSEMTYVSFMPADDSRLTIRHAKYPLNEENYFFKKCYTSNEFVDRDIEIELDKGYVVVIYSKDKI